MGECELCKQGDRSITVRCHKCHGTFHVHKRQLDKVLVGTVILADCPNCGTVNCWIRFGNSLAKSGSVVYTGQPIQDLRGSR